MSFILFVKFLPYEFPFILINFWKKSISFKFSMNPRKFNFIAYIPERTIFGLCSTSRWF